MSSRSMSRRVSATSSDLSQAGTSRQHHHRPLAKIQLSQKRCEFGWRQHVRFSQPFGLSPHFRDRVGIAHRRSSESRGCF